MRTEPPFLTKILILASSQVFLTDRLNIVDRKIVEGEPTEDQRIMEAGFGGLADELVAVPDAVVVALATRP